MRRWIAAIIFVVLAASCQRVSFRGKALETPRPVPGFALIDQHGQAFTFTDQRGRVVLVFFGYTRCPDVCPFTLATFRDVARQLGPEAARVRFVFVTVDPEQDTPAFLNRYMRLFHPDFVGLTGTPEALKPVYAFFGASFRRVKVPNSAVGYLMAHSVNVAVIDRDGRWRVNLDHNAPAADMLHDIRQLLR
ncbi:MAG: SCO family protein [Armatimonadota bacterium]|nr:SCO family protein [Armatimonadota bacterium]